MGKQPFISHVVNGYSRYDVPESKAFTCTPGILYPVRIDFINARDRVRIEQGIDVRSNPLAVPSFNPYTIRLHRFWVPLQLYHPEMRTNSSKFDMNDLSLNWLPYSSTSGVSSSPVFTDAGLQSYSNSLFAWLRYGVSEFYPGGTSSSNAAVALDSRPTPGWVNADSYLAYWDIVRNYYSYSTWSLYSYAWPASWRMSYASSFTFSAGGLGNYFTQDYGNLEYLDAYFESQFYPSAVQTTNNTYNRWNLFPQIVQSRVPEGGIGDGQDGYPVYSGANVSFTAYPNSQLATTIGSKQEAVAFTDFLMLAHPMAVIPSNPDRFSRLIPYGGSSAVSMTGVDTIPKLAVASRLQEYKDLLGAGGNRFSDWLETFFASKIEHVDRPKLLFAASQTVNVQVVMNQSGTNNFGDDPMTGSSGNPLGQQGGSIAFNDRLGRSQSYYFREPGYMIDMLSIRPVYYWSGIRPDYVNYQGADYFNPIYNDIGYQDVPTFRLGINNPVNVFASEPCFNEFRSSYDEVLGQFLPVVPADAPEGVSRLYSYWVQQRNITNFTYSSSQTYFPALFVDMTTVNSPFKSMSEDNFFVNMSWNVQKKNLVNKTFATRLSNR